MSSIEVRLDINGHAQSHTVEPRTSLADLLRGACQLTGTHLGCEHGVCGACTVIVDGAPVRSCILYAAQANASSVTTIEGFDDDPLMAELRDAFTRHHALQCGFCTPGMLITARDIVMRLPQAEEARVREELGGNLCRCTGYVGIVRAVMEVAGHPRTAAVAATAPAAVPIVAAPLDTESAATCVAESADTVTILESVAIPHPAARVWEALADLERVARCLPGAQITAIEGDKVRGQLRIRFGPIVSVFEIEGLQARDDAKRIGHVTGHGRDRLTGSRARGRIDFAMGVSAGADDCRLAMKLGFSLQGTLAQFSRGALMQDLARQLIAQFATNLSATLAGHAPLAAASLNPLAMLWRAIRRRWAHAIGRRPKR
jgi:carbon-monoxide dehydrogenase small subunit